MRSFFSENENNRAINAIMRVMECINIRPDQIGTEKKGNCKFTNVQVLNLLMLFPFFVVRNAYRYSGSSLSRLFCCEKDMFYRFMNDGNIKWRKLLYAMNLQLLRKISRSTEAEHDKPVCLIIDDTDAPKSGRKSELIGKVFSHLEHKTILGYKCLTLLLSDGMSQLFLDFSLHGEEGRKPDKKQGLTDRQRKARYSKDHSGEAVEERIKEYTMSKIDKAIEMVKYAIKRGIRFDYLLIDSWFTCADFVRLITSRHIKCHLIGMIKLGKTKYHTQWGDLTANQIIKKLQKQGLTKHNRTLIANFTLTMMQYNILCTVKRFEAYETAGALFREATAGTLELSAADRIWELILDTILKIAEMISADASELLSAIIDANPKFHKFYQMYKLVA